MIYEKPFLSLDEQAARLIGRGMIIDDKDKAKHYLSNISFYRLRAYTYPYQDNNDPNHPFIRPIKFEQIIELYRFDRKLRIIVFDALEKIEVSLRCKLIYYYAEVYGSHWLLDQNIFRNVQQYNNDLARIKKEIERSPEIFIKHYKNKYTEPELPPVWMILEVLSLGLLSKVFENIRKDKIKKQICTEFGLLHVDVLESWMHSFSFIRNICAHHGRIWNRRITNMPKLPHNTKFQFIDNLNIDRNKLYPILCCMTYVLDRISPGHQFRNDLIILFNEFNSVNQRELGMPDQWQDEIFWKIQ